MNQLVVFARWPVPGRVKSRLSPALPSDLACRLYQAMLRDVLQAGRQVSVERRWLDWADGPPDATGDAPQADDYQPSTQRGADLGARLERAIGERLRAGDQLVVVGADAPELTGATLAGAFARLATHDLVLGPTRDGGYYLLGLNRPTPEVFRDIPWGTDQVFARTQERAAAAGLRATSLDPLEDVDTPADLVRLTVRCLEEPDLCPHTRSVLREIGLLPDRGA